MEMCFREGILLREDNTEQVLQTEGDNYIIQERNNRRVFICAPLKEF
jgi:hypothetical protein